ncbi:MAG: hypothetical protein LBI13_07410 [Streptococcaceae bacterium]|jgi:hypothetical protein|nr:hypothetical protein [Streptococcaceae bacterium]
MTTRRKIQESDLDYFFIMQGKISYFGELAIIKDQSTNKIYIIDLLGGVQSWLLFFIKSKARKNIYEIDDEEFSKQKVRNLSKQGAPLGMFNRILMGLIPAIIVGSAFFFRNIGNIFDSMTISFLPNYPFLRMIISVIFVVLFSFTIYEVYSWRRRKKLKEFIIISKSILEYNYFRGWGLKVLWLIGFIATLISSMMLTNVTALSWLLLSIIWMELIMILSTRWIQLCLGTANKATKESKKIGITSLYIIKQE